MPAGAFPDKELVTFPAVIHAASALFRIQYKKSLQNNHQSWVKIYVFSLGTTEHSLFNCFEEYWLIRKLGSS